MAHAEKIDLLLAFAEAHTTESDVGATMRALASEVRALRAIAASLAKELGDVREHLVDMGTDEASEGIVGLDAALHAYAHLGR